ncbi:MAG: cytochrome-c oxidase, cbb3-type subunit I, partial [Fibrobacterales bacterium]
MINVTYDNQITKNYLIATLLWAAVGMLVGVLIALQLADPMFNFGVEWLSYGRLRPLHTNAVIFAFAGNAIFMGIYYSTQRLLKVRMFSDLLTKVHFWGWQFIIVCAAVTLLLGWTTGKEYAELEWWIDILIVLVWVSFAINFFGTIAKRNEKHIYVALWFYIATIVTIAILHIVNSIELPVAISKSYPVYAGVQDALVQWWYGHNAVGFFLTTPFLGMMYYFLPKAANGPVYSYRLSIIHFWALVFLYIWTGPHHLQYSSLPDWAQNLGMVFSIMLWAPSWGGMINGLMTLRGSWEKLKSDPILKFMVTAVTFYGMATFEGPLLSIKSVNALSHYTDWTIGHTHSAVLGWNGFLAFGVIYWLVPRLWKRELFSQKLANIHFWVALIGIVGYMVSMWIAGITQGLMWKEFDSEGMLVYTQFLDTLTAIIPMYWVRMVSGLAYFLSLFIMVYNLVKTVKGAKVEDETVEVAEPTWKTEKESTKGLYWHTVLERKPLFMAIGVAVLILSGTVVELVPAFIIKSNVPTISSVKPYTALELEGRDIY